MKKKVLFPILALVLALGLAVPMAMPAGAHIESDPFTTDLLAGQTEDVGNVSVWNDGTTLYVKYETTGGWEMTETHLHVADQLVGIPQTQAKGKGKGNVGGNPIPGHFSDGDYYDPPVTNDTFTFNLTDEGWSPCNDLCIAAHAVVVKETETELVENGSFEYPEIDNPPYNWDAIPSGAADLAWTVSWYDPSSNWSTTAPAPALLEIRENKGATADDGDQFVELDTAHGSPPRPGIPEPASVTISQSVTACPSGLYTLRYAWAPRADHADNQVEVMWNGSSLTTHSASGVGGTNWTSEEHAYLAGPSSGTFTLAFRETGTADGKGMYLDSVSLVCFEEETAWGNGDDFPGKNWATYIEYHVQYMPTGVAGDGWTSVASDYDWEARARHGGAGGWRAFVDDVWPPVNTLNTGGIVPWLNGGQMWFELTYDASTNSTTFTIYDASDDSVLGTVTDSSVPGFNGLIGIQGKTSPEAAGSVVVDNVEVNGVLIEGDDGFTAQGTDFSRDLEHLTISYVPSGSFTLTGNLTFTWGANPRDEGPALSIYVQNNP